MKKPEKLSKLKEIISSYGSAAVAFSGGVDSTFLLKIALDVLGRDNILAVTGVSETYTEEELDRARQFAEKFDIPHQIIKTTEFENEKFIENSHL